MPFSPPSRRSPRPLTLLLWIVLALLSVSVAFVPIRADNDCWWHVKTGLYILDHGLPEHDIFSYTASDHKWDNHEWLTQVLMAAAWRWGESSGVGGWRAVIALTALFSLLSWAAVAWLVQRRIRHWPLALFLAICAVAIGRRTLFPRPPVVTYFLFALSLWILYEVRLGRWKPRRLLWMIPLTALWSNLHGGWMAALAAIAFFAADAFARHTFAWAAALARPAAAPPPRAAEERRAARAREQALAYSLLLMACAAAACLNPYGWRLYLLPGRVMSDPWLVRLIGELRPPDLYFTVAFLVALLAAGAGFALVRRRPVALADAALFLFWGWQAGQHVRHLPMFAVAAAPLLGVLARQALADAHRLPGAAWLRAPRWSAWAIGAAALALAFYVAKNPRESDSYFRRNAALLAGEDYVRRNYPAEACDFVLLNDLRGRLFNRNFYAGYLIWRLAPEQTLVFTDSRFDIFGGKFLRDEYIIAEGEEDPAEGPLWRKKLAEYQIDWIILPESLELNARLEAIPGEWELVYRDGPWSRAPAGFRVWMRVAPETQEMRARCRRSLEALAARAAAAPRPMAPGL